MTPRRDDSAGDYTTIGLGKDWYGHPGPMTEGETVRQRTDQREVDQDPFDVDKSQGQIGRESDRREQERNTADYAYGGYGKRKPGRAKSDPYPLPSQSGASEERSTGRA